MKTYYDYFSDCIQHFIKRGKNLWYNIPTKNRRKYIYIRDTILKYENPEILEILKKQEIKENLKDKLETLKKDFGDIFSKLRNVRHNELWINIELLAEEENLDNIRLKDIYKIVNEIVNKIYKDDINNKNIFFFLILFTKFFIKVINNEINFDTYDYFLNYKIFPLLEALSKERITKHYRYKLLNPKDLFLKLIRDKYTYLKFLSDLKSYNKDHEDFLIILQKYRRNIFNANRDTIRFFIYIKSGNRNMPQIKEGRLIREIIQNLRIAYIEIYEKDNELYVISNKSLHKQKSKNVSWRKYTEIINNFLKKYYDEHLKLEPLVSEFHKLYTELENKFYEYIKNERIPKFIEYFNNDIKSKILENIEKYKDSYTYYSELNDIVNSLKFRGILLEIGEGKKAAKIIIDMPDPYSEYLDKISKALKIIYEQLLTEIKEYRLYFIFDFEVDNEEFVLQIGEEEDIASINFEKLGINRGILEELYDLLDKTLSK